jgi:hypothetical protein
MGGILTLEAFLDQFPDIVSHLDHILLGKVLTFISGSRCKNRANDQLTSHANPITRGLSLPRRLVAGLRTRVGWTGSHTIDLRLP